MTSPPLDERSREVLKSIIQLHVATGEPVGSESLARTLGRALSSATLRSIMAELEKKGYVGNELRQRLAREAFALTAEYDQSIRDYLAGQGQ